MSLNCFPQNKPVLVKKPEPETPDENWIPLNQFPNVVAATAEIQDILPQDGDFLVNKKDILNKYTFQRLEDFQTGKLFQICQKLFHII